MKVLVAGAGAIGQWLAARLQVAGHDVTIWTTPRHVSAARHVTVRGHSEFTGALRAVTEPPRESFPVAVLTAKAHMTQILGPHLAHHGTVVSLQNGLGNMHKLSAVMAPEKLVCALTSHGVTLEAPGRLFHAGAGWTRLGPRHATAAPGRPLHRASRVAVPDLQRVSRLLADARLDPICEDDMRPYVWAKALVNHAINPIAALAGLPNGALLDDAALHDRALALLSEAVALGNAAGMAPPANSRHLLDSILTATRDNRVSMLQDLEGRRRTEIDCMTGRMLRIAGRLGVDMPLSAQAYAEVRKREDAFLGPHGPRLAIEEARWDPRELG